MQLPCTSGRTVQRSGAGPDLNIQVACAALQSSACRFAMIGCDASLTAACAASCSAQVHLLPRNLQAKGTAF